MLLKSASDYFDLNADFAPLPLHGNLSVKAPAWEAAEPAVTDAFARLWSQPDFPSFRVAAGNADAAIPPGGPDRYRDIADMTFVFPARDGKILDLKVYKSVNVNENATLMYRMHGGGCAVGGHETDGAENVYAAANPDIVVVSVDYRLAPEHPFPQPLEDSYDGLLWCISNADLLGINPQSIILSGSSAGANLAASLALEVKRNKIPGVVAQVLNFPAVSHPKFFPKDKYEYGSMIQNQNNGVLSLLMMETFFDAYIPDPKPDSRHSPLLAESLQDLPPACENPPYFVLTLGTTRGPTDGITNLQYLVIQIGGADVLRDDGFAYAEALRAAQVEVEVHAYAGLPHCFPSFLLDIPQTAEFYKNYENFLRKYAKRNS